MEENLGKQTDIKKTVEFVGGSTKRRRNPFSWRGYLTPDFDENAKDLSSSFGVHEIRSTHYTVGRHPQSNLVLTSPDISREHARIHRIHGDFYVEDLASRHGTYLNGDRIIWSRLADGDILQFGAKSRRSNVWYFDKAAIRKESQEEPTADQFVPRPEHLPEDQLVVTFWGCRGSVPTPGAHTEAYGGNTTCVEVRYGENIFIIDSGTGIRFLGESLLREFPEESLQLNLFFTHLHWDHIQGFPFLTPAYNGNNSLRIFGIDSEESTVQDLLRNQMQGRYFPIPMDAMRANLQFEQLTDQLEIGGVKITTIELPHPGGALAYRLSTENGTFIFATDCELNAIAENQNEIGATAIHGRQFPQEFIDFFQGADLLVIDCQYTDEQYESRIGWGHNSVSTVIDFCCQTEVRAAALTHHDPSASDADIRRIVEQMDTILRAEMQEMAPKLFAAREEMMVAVNIVG